MPFSSLRRQGRNEDDDERSAPPRNPTPTPRGEEDDREPGESDKAYELRKAMESTSGGDTRSNRERY